MDAVAARPIRRSQVERRDEAQRRLVDATMEIVAAEGVSAATFEAIGRQAGYSRGLVTQHFGSKQALIDEVVSTLQARQAAGVEHARLDELSGLDALLAYAVEYCRELETSQPLRAYFMLLSGAVADRQEARTVFARSHELVRVILRGMIERGQAEGCIRRDVDADSAALMAGSLLFGLSMQALTDPEMKIGPVSQAIIETLERSLSTLPTTGDRHGRN